MISSLEVLGLVVRVSMPCNSISDGEDSGLYFGSNQEKFLYKTILAESAPKNAKGKNKKIIAFIIFYGKGG